jgi:hypothetical protein
MFAGMIGPPPIFISGAPRTGTTWLGRMLGLSQEIAEIYEPFNPNATAGLWLRTAAWYPYIDAHNEGDFLDPMRRIVDLRFPLADRLVAARSPRAVRDALRTAAWAARMRRQQRRVLVKDPIALFATPWLANTFGFTPVLIVRHPAAFVSSVLRVDWRVQFGSWVRQPRLMETLLAPWAGAIRAAAREPKGAVYDSALFWRAATGVIAGYRAEHPDWTVVRHEDLATDPQAQFASLYQQLGLSLSDEVVARLDAATADTNPTDAGSEVHVLARDSRALVFAWHGRLDDHQLQEVRAVTDDVASLFYDDASWQPRR